MNSLKALANSWTGKGVTFYVMPFATVAQDEINDAMAEIVPKAKWTSAHYVFIGLNARVIDLEFAEELSKPILALRFFWENRTSSFLDDWTLFRKTIGKEAMNLFWEALEVTRDETVQQGLAVSESQKKDELTASENAADNSLNPSSEPSPEAVGSR